MADTLVNGTNIVDGAHTTPGRVPAEDPPLPDVSASAWTKVGDGGWIVIPAEIRQLLGLKSGSSILLRVEDGELRLLTTGQAIARAQELARPYIRPGISVVDELIAERRAENARDEEEARAMAATRE